MGNNNLINKTTEMARKLQITGTQTVNGQAIKIIEGGFGEGQKCMLAKTIAELHDEELRRINEIINRNREEFEDGIDILDLKQIANCDLFLDSGIFTKAQWGNAANVYLLSEQGYMLLVGFMKTDKAKEIRKQLRREYFQMRSQIKKTYTEKEMMIAQLQGQIELEQKLNVVDHRTLKIESELNNLPLLGSDSDELKEVVNQKMVRLLGGKGAPAYKIFNRKAFADLYKELHRNFGVKKICFIKRRDLNDVKEVIRDYTLPFNLRKEIEIANNQLAMEV